MNIWDSSSQLLSCFYPELALLAKPWWYFVESRDLPRSAEWGGQARASGKGRNQMLQDLALCWGESKLLSQAPQATPNVVK